MKQILNDIKNGSFARVYLLTGPEGYLRRFYAKKLADAICPERDTMNRAVLSGDKADENEIISLCDTLPFLAERRLVLVRDSGFFKSAANRLPDYVKKLPEETVLIFSESECDKRNRLYKAVKAAGYIAEFPVQTEATLLSWSAKILSNAGLRISRSDLSYLIARVGTDMGLLSLELDKLACFCRGQEAVRREDIEAVCVEQLDDNIFKMLEAVTRRDRREALAIYADMLSRREPPMRIIVLLARQYSQLLMLRELIDAGVPASEFVSRTGMNPYAVRKLGAAVRRYKASQLKKALAECVAMQEAITGGNLSDRLSVELLIVRLSA
ncbi:MAG: DNA polymerase III subunit delta [Lachnospiraceae bacterium]|nr:DNA polymerase III subunit delta [Lachnospiraceae bacterium]